MMDDPNLIKARQNMDEFIKTHKMPDHTEEHVKQYLGAVEPVVTAIEAPLPDPDTVIKVESLPAAEKQLINESVAELQISPSRGDKKMDESFPKYQYSIFLDNNRNGQMVIRADSWEEFESLLSKAGLQMQRKIEMNTTQMATPQPVQPQTTFPEPVKPTQNGLTAKCVDCGADMVEKSGFKNGKQWHALFCPNAVKGNTTQHKPVWL